MIKTIYKTQDGEQFEDLQTAQAHEYWLIREKDNQAQELMFELMKIASFNGFDGNYVVNKLKERNDLWSGAVMDSGGSEYTLRDIGNGSWHVDTLNIKPKQGKEEELLKWVKKEIGGDKISQNKKGIVSIWWD